jgi:hypothetical protein
MWCSISVHFFRNFIRPLGDVSRAVHIVDFDFFFSGLTGGVRVLLSMTVLFNELATVVITILLTDATSEARLVCSGPNTDNFLSLKMDIEDSEGEGRLKCGDGDDGVGILSESDSRLQAG